MTMIPAGHGFDLDPTKAVGQDIEQNQRNVQKVATAFLAVISSSVPTIPPCVFALMVFRLSLNDGIQDVPRDLCAHLEISVSFLFITSKPYSPRVADKRFGPRPNLPL